MIISFSFFSIRHELLAQEMQLNIHNTTQHNTG